MRRSMICSHILYGHFSGPVKGFTGLPQHSQTLRYLPPQSTSRPGSLSRPLTRPLTRGWNTKGPVCATSVKGRPLVLWNSESLLAQLANHPSVFRRSSCPCNSWGDCCLWTAQQSACARRPVSAGWQKQFCCIACKNLPRSWERRSRCGGRGRHGPGM